MPRFARLFEAAADTLTAYYQALAEGNLDHLMSLWIDEEFVSCIRADGPHLHGLEEIRAGFARRFEQNRMHVEALDIRVYDSLGTVVYAIAEAHRLGSDPVTTMVFATYVMVHDRGEWKIAHIHASPMPQDTAAQFTAKLRHGHGQLH
jgi:ketosteroid isomerase-like protein